MRRLYYILVSLVIISMPVSLYASKVVVIGDNENILIEFLNDAGKHVEVVGDMNAALKTLCRGDGLIICADGYPSSLTPITQSDYAHLAKLSIRLFVEYPASLPNSSTPDTYTADLERGVVTSSKLGLSPMSIVGINGCQIVKAKSKKPLIVLGKVAGYDTAVFGLEDVDPIYPILFQEGKALIATTSFSNAIKGRYGPTNSWKNILSYVLGWVCSDKKFIIRNYPVDPHPAYNKNDPLPANAAELAVENAAQWLWNANLLIHPEWEKPLLKKYQPVGGDPNRFFGEPITDDMLHGDGSRGIMEGHASNVDYNGVQEYRYFVRADVHGESAFLLASAAQLTDNQDYNSTAERLLDYLFYSSCFRDGQKSEKGSNVYGLLGWSNTAPEAFFNDDNARCILGVIGATALTGNRRWDTRVVENILANYRLSSDKGFIGSCLMQSDIEEKGWKWYAERNDFVNPSPHFESWMWALYLWLYEHSGYKPLLDKAEAGLSYMMNIYPDWKVQNGIQQERARIILPLAWLVRVDDTPEHRKWLDTVVRAFLKNQDDCGAIREELGLAEFDANKLLITSNSEYGKNEASLIARNGDKVADMLYTCNFGFFALNEAYKATGLYKDEVDKLADFLVRIQVKSDAHNDLNGAWFRAFDYGRWDYWASNADNGWGAWCTLCGWIETWIAVTEYLHKNDTSYWNITDGVDMKKTLANCLWMLDK